MAAYDFMTANDTILTPLPNFAANQTAFQTAVKQIESKCGFVVKTLAEGMYSFLVSKPGYQNVVMALAVTGGEMKEVDVKMEGV